MIEMTVQPGVSAAASLADIKMLATRFPGVHELTLRVAPAGSRKAITLTLGPLWMYDASPACLAALSEFGSDVKIHT